MPISLEGENPVSEADTEPPVAGFGGYGGSTVLGGHGEVYTWRPDMHSGRVKAVFIRIRARSCDRSSSRAPRHAHPAALRPPQSEERSDQIRGTGVTCGPRRPKGPVMGSQAHGGHPAAASRPGTLTYKFIRSGFADSCAR